MSIENSITLTKKVGFYYPSRQLGGAEILIVRYFNFLKENGIEVFIITENSAEIYFSLINDSRDIILAKDFQWFSIQENWTIIIPVPLCFHRELNKYFHGATLIAWVLHPGLITSQISRRFLISYLSELRLRALVKSLIKSNSLWYLDYECYNQTAEVLKLNNIVPSLMPLLLDENHIPRINQNKRENISLAFVQRAVKPKLVSVELLLNQITQSYSDRTKKLDIHFIGDGVQEIISKDYSEYFNNVYFHSAMTNNDLRDFMNRNIDITVAMGQTALDAAYSGNVSILTDLVVHEFDEKDFKFNFIYENNLSLGGFYNNKLYSEKSNDIHKLLELIENPTMLAKQKRLSQEFVVSHYMKSNDKLINLINSIEKASYKI